MDTTLLWRSPEQGKVRHRTRCSFPPITAPRQAEQTASRHGRGWEGMAAGPGPQGDSSVSSLTRGWWEAKLWGPRRKLVLLLQSRQRHNTVAGLPLHPVGSPPPPGQYYTAQGPTGKEQLCSHLETSWGVVAKAQAGCSEKGRKFT